METFIFFIHKIWCVMKIGGGLSGTPIIDEEGKCVAVLTDVLEGTNSVWGISIKRLETLLDIISFEENREL